MILYGSYTSPYVRHCRIQLNLLGERYDFVETDYAASAKGSPTKRVPYLQDGELALTDSTSILMHVLNKHNQGFIQTANEMDHYCLAGTALDTAINLFLLEKEGQTPDNNRYLKRQEARVQAALKALDEIAAEFAGEFGIANIRTACLLDWGLYRQRFTLDGLDHLESLLASARAWDAFANTAPPAE